MKIKYLTLILLVPVINIAVLITSPYLGDYHLGYLRIPFFAFLILLSIPLSIKKTLISKTVIYLSFLYFSILILFSDFFLKSLEGGSKFFTSIGMFLVAYSIIKNIRDVYKIINVIYYCFILLVAFFFISQILNIGLTVYETDIYLPRGGRGVYVTNVLVYFSLLLPIVIRSEYFKFKTKVVYFILVLATLFILVLVFRRSSLLAFIVGFIIILTLGLKNRVIFRTGLILVILLLMISPFLADYFYEGLQSRGGIEVMTSEDFGRVREFDYVIETFQDFNLIQFFFGRDVFNYHLYLGVYRRIHNDFTNLYLSSGIFGLILFIGLHLSILYDAIKNNAEKENKISRITTISLIATTLTISMANQIWVVSSLSTAFFVLGLVVKLGHLYKYKNQ